MNLRALVLDFDGLILDTEGPEFLAWKGIYETHGVALELDTWQVAIGTRDAFDPYEHLEALVGRRLDRAALADERRRRNRELVAAERLRPGVVELIEEARRRGLRLGIASSSTTDWVLTHLGTHGVADAFVCVACADDPALAKPAPHLYLQVLEELGVDATEAIAFEDSAHGVAAAKAAGLYCVAVPNDWTRTMDLSAADLVVGSLTEVDLDDVVASVRD